MKSPFLPIIWVILVFYLVNCKKKDENKSSTDSPIENELSDEELHHYQEIIEDEHYDEILNKMKIKDKVVISKKALKAFFFKFVVGEERLTAQEKTSYKLAIDKVTESAPEKIPTKNIPKYINERLFMEYLDEIHPKVSVTKPHDDLYLFLLLKLLNFKQAVKQQLFVFHY